MSRFDLNLLVSLDALLRERNVTVAAEHIGVSQPTMSGMLLRLRQQLKDPLLIRAGKGFNMTPRARELSDTLRQTLLTIERLIETKANFSLQREERHLRIMVSEFSMFMILPAVFHVASVEAPNLTFEVLPMDDPAENVYSGNVDLCITGNTIADIYGGAASVVRTRILGSDGFVGVVDKSHPLRGVVTMAELHRYPHVATQFPGVPRTVEENTVIETNNEGMELINSTRIRVPSFLAIGPILTGTNMIGIVPQHMISLLAPEWNLRTIDLPPDFVRTSLRALWHCRHDQDPVHRWLREAVMNACAFLAKEPNIAANSNL